MPTKTSEFLTLLRQYRGLVGEIRFQDIWISFDTVWFNYYFDDDEIQFNLASQEGCVSIKSVVSYEKMEPEDLLEGAVAGYEATLSTGQVVTFHCFNSRNSK